MNRSSRGQIIHRGSVGATIGKDSVLAADPVTQLGAPRAPGFGAIFESYHGSTKRFRLAVLVAAGEKHARRIHHIVLANRMYFGRPAGKAVTDLQPLVGGAWRFGVPYSLCRSPTFRL